VKNSQGSVFLESETHPQTGHISIQNIKVKQFFLIRILM
jgi:hypothetical protein